MKPSTNSSFAYVLYGSNENPTVMILQVGAVYFIDVTKRLRITTFSLSLIYLENAVKIISQGGDHKMRTQKNITRWEYKGI